MTAADVARALDVPKATVSRWLSGERKPSPESVDRLTDLFGADVTTVMQLAGHLPATEPIDPDDPKARLMGKLRRLKLDDGQVELLDAMLDTWLNQQRKKRRSQS